MLQLNAMESVASRSQFLTVKPGRDQTRKRDQAIAGLIDSMRQLQAPPDPRKRPIGFVIPDETPAKK